MPGDWKKSGRYDVQYEHTASPGATFAVTCVPVGDVFIVHGKFVSFFGRKLLTALSFTLEESQIVLQFPKTVYLDKNCLSIAGTVKVADEQELCQLKIKPTEFYQPAQKGIWCLTKKAVLFAGRVVH